MQQSNSNIQEIQLIEQSLHQIIMHKQAFQMEASETKTALEEVKKSGEEVYKIIGQLMLKSEKKDIIKNLEEKQKILDLRIKSLEKQEETMTKQLEKLRDEILKPKKK